MKSQSERIEFTRAARVEPFQNCIRFGMHMRMKTIHVTKREIGHCNRQLIVINPFNGLLFCLFLNLFTRTSLDRFINILSVE